MKKITFLIIFISSFGYSQTLVKTYYDPLHKTKIKEVYQVKKNTPIVNGYYKAYDRYGYLLVHRNYINNKQNGKSTTYYGADEASVSYGGKECLGKISGVYNYKNDQLDGVQQKYSYSKDGIRYLNFKQIYNNGIEIESFEYYSNKKLKQHNKLNGVCTGFYESGNKFEQFTLKNGIYQGEYTYWYESGKILEQGQMVNDKKNGEWIEYNEDGTIKSKELFELGKRVPTQEEKELARQKEIERAEKEKEKRILAEQKEIERKKRIEEEKKRKSEIQKNEIVRKNVYQLKQDYEMDLLYIESSYKYWDETSYKYEKPKLYNAFSKVKNYLSGIINSNEASNSQKLKALETGIEIISRMKELSNESTGKLERELKKVNDTNEIINLILNK